MFRLANQGKVWARVDLLARDRDDGEPTDVPVLLLMKIYTRSELKAKERKVQDAIKRVTKSIAATAKAAGKAGAESSADDVATSMQEVETLEAATTKDLIDRISDWKQIAGEDGEPLPFSRDALKALLDDEAQYTRVQRALLDVSRGAVAKNSSPGPAGSRAPALN